jgi:hypothetical protein
MSKKDKEIAQKCDKCKKIVNEPLFSNNQMEEFLCAKCYAKISKIPLTDIPEFWDIIKKDNK